MVMSLADGPGILFDRLIVRGEIAMTAEPRTMPGFMGYAAILVIFAVLIGPALL